ncbi:hypothetical protein CRYUN_Cryun05aG0042300 [Craigia yunnanensis]
MAGIVHKIGETLKGGQKKDEEKHKGEGHLGHEEHKVGEVHHGDQHKEGIMDKIKDKISGGGGAEHAHDGKKKKKEKKKHADGHESSSSDSD